MKKRCFAFLILLLFIFSSVAMSVSALTTVSSSFVLDSNGARIAIPESYSAVKLVESFEGANPPLLNNAQDIFYDEKGFYYIADSGNNRILKLDGQFNFIAEFFEADGLAFANPTGVSAFGNGHVYIADSGNARVVHLDENGIFIESFIKPESDLLYNVEFFSPAKIEIGPLNYHLYVIQGKQFMTIDAGNQFKGYLGANKIGFDLWDYIFRKFASEKQKMQQMKREPDPYFNFCLDENGRIYAVGNNDNQRISVFNTVGNNIYPSKPYGETLYDSKGAKNTPMFTDIAVNSLKIISVSDENTGCIYQYDLEGNLLCAFGGKGSSQGFFGIISSLVVNKDGKIVTLDSSLNRIQIFQPTHFINTVHEAVNSFHQGEYSDSLTSWETVKKMDAGYTLARKFIGELNYKNENYSLALNEFRQGDDRQNYGKAFERIRYLVFQDHFVWVAAAVCVFLIVFFFVLIKGRKLIKNLRKELWKAEN